MSSKPVFPHSSVGVLVHVQPQTGLLLATCEAIPGFAVVAKNDEELQAKLPAAIEEFLQFAGYAPGRVRLEIPTPLGGKFLPARFCLTLEPLAA